MRKYQIDFNFTFYLRLIVDIIFFRLNNTQVSYEYDFIRIELINEQCF